MKTKKQYLLKGAIDGLLLGEIFLCLISFTCWAKEVLPSQVESEGFQNIVRFLFYNFTFQLIWGWFIIPPLTLAGFLLASKKWNKFANIEANDGR
jgi:hypothetical protein